MFGDADNFADAFHNSIPYYFLITLPILIICFSNPVLGSSEFTVHRMSQYDINGVAYGCRASALNLEAKSLYTWSTSRHCVITRFQDITIDQFTEIRSKAGGLIALLPKDISLFNHEDKEQLYHLEQYMMAQEISIPVYFSHYNDEMEKIINDITNNADDMNINNNSLKMDNNNKPQQHSSAFSELMTTLSANGYQIFISGNSHLPNKQSKIPIIQGELIPNKNFKQSSSGDNKISNELPLILIVAHLDTFALYNEYLLNSDVTVMFTLIDLFSKLYSIPNTMPKYRIMFIISESGSIINFQGIKKWFEENNQIKPEHVHFVLCLDTISQPISRKTISNKIYMHVSKPPKDNSPMNNFYQNLKFVSAKYNNITIDGIHKKINLAEIILGWEHERFNIKRFSGFTLSSLNSHRDPLRVTTFKDYNSKKQIILNIQKSAKIIAESLARYIYDINENDDGEIFAGSNDVTTKLIEGWMHMKSMSHNNDIKNAFEKYLKRVKIFYEKPDTKEPEFMLYEGQDASLLIYRVKPAIFDLFLTLLIAAYLGCVYLSIIYFPQFYNTVCKMSKIPTLTKSKFN